MDTKNIGLFLLKQRKENSLTQADIAKLCNVSAQAVSKWERGESIPDIGLLERLSILYKISINEIISGEKKELYIDIKKRSQVVSLTFSILVFISYLFPFAKARFILDDYNIDATIILKGYEILFDGISGIIVYATMIVFMLLLSLVIINVFVLSRILILNSNIVMYEKISSYLILTIALLGMVFGFYLPIPQVIIVVSVVALLVIMNNGSIKPEIILTKRIEYLQMRKNDVDVTEFEFTPSISNVRKLRFLQTNIVLFIFVLFLAFANFLLVIASNINSEMNSNSLSISFVVLVMIATNIGFYGYTLRCFKLKTSSVLYRFCSFLSFIYTGIVLYAIYGVLNYSSLEGQLIYLFLLSLVLVYMAVTTYLFYKFSYDLEKVN